MDFSGQGARHHSLLHRYPVSASFSQGHHSRTVCWLSFVPRHRPGVAHRAVAVRPAGGAVAVVIVVGGHLPAVAGVGGGAAPRVVAEGLRMPLLVGGGRGQGI